jgi:DNA-directed RNA polymerase subunit RPC12/RpoP
MYAVVGCRECSNLWIIEGRSETTRCPRCGSRRAYEKRRKFVETDDAAHARDVRASMLANRQGEGDAFAELESFDALEDEVADGVVDDADYLAESGLDVDAVEAAGDRDPRGPTRSGSKREVVEAALEALDRPTEDEVVAYAANRGVDGEAASAILEKLARRGVVSESRGRYRLL